ncbi:urease accessory protein UreF, partial [Streptomyces sp. NPDC057496]
MRNVRPDGTNRAADGTGRAPDGTVRPSTTDDADRAMSRAALLVLADGRFPAGGHAHSGGAEAAVEQGRVRDAGGLAAFCRGRLHT